jgi:hypothetical protein
MQHQEQQQHHHHHHHQQQQQQHRNDSIRYLMESRGKVCVGGG